MNELMRYKVRTGQSYTDLAKKAGVAIPTIWRHCNGTREMTLRFALIYSKKFRIPISKLAEEKDETYAL